MEGLSNTLWIVLMFVLRLGVPILITALIAYGLSKLDKKWQAEADAEMQKEAQIRPTQPAQMPAPRPAAQPAKYQLPARQPIPLAAKGDTAGMPCWGVKGCSEEMRAHCAAPKQPGIPCWAARTSAEGKLPPECLECQLYDPKVYMPNAPIWNDRGQDMLH